MKTTRKNAKVLAAILAVLISAMTDLGCGGDGPAGARPTPDGGATGGSGGATGGCTDTGECDDGFACTIDSCSSGSCQHTIGPNSGPTACPSGQFCTLEQGCAAPPACATIEDCEEAWHGDACKANVRCDPASSLCLFDVLDKDEDGHPPQVCGGDDCDDGDGDRFPGRAETCDGRDNDCDGDVDDGATCLNPLKKCEGGACQCPSENDCAGECVDKSTDIFHCGHCGNACPLGAQCSAGVCVCPGGQEDCAGTCTNTSSDALHCGQCYNSCASGAQCVSGTCTCPVGNQDCGGICVDVSSSLANCGQCNHACPSGATCLSGTCTCPVGQQECSSACVDTSIDVTNCGTCGTTCPTNANCISGTCACPGHDQVCDGSCVDTRPVQFLQPIVMFAVDRTRTMACNLPPTQSTSQCESLHQKLDPGLPSKIDVLRDRINVELPNWLAAPEPPATGLTLFPTSDSCGFPTTATVSPATLDSSTMSAISAALQSGTIGSDAPIVGTVLGMYNFFQYLTGFGSKYVLFVTDGTETCDPGATDYLLQKVGLALTMGIRTFVVGIPGSEVGRSLLSRMAFNGGTAHDSTCDHSGASATVGDCHMDLSLAGASFSSDLAIALEHVRRSAMCEFDFPSGVDASLVNVTVTNGGAPFQTIPRYESIHCDSPTNDGWQLNGSLTRIRLCNAVCQTVLSSPTVDVELDLGCPTVVK
jgi:hypothetical protein